MIPEKLRNIYCRTTFGLQTSSADLDAITFVDDKGKYRCIITELHSSLYSPNPLHAYKPEILIVTGNRICSIVCGDLEGSKKHRQNFLPTVANVLLIRCLTLSPCYRYVAAAVGLSNSENAANAIIYERDHTAELFQKPALVSHPGSTSSSLLGDLEFTKLAYCADSTLLAGVLSDVQLGVVIYEWRSNSLLRALPYVSFVNEISFHPTDNSRICTIGRGSLLRFWHFNDRYANDAPVTCAGGTPLPKREYTCLTWVNKQQVIVGSTDGILTVIKGCDAKQTRVAFSQEEDYECRVSKIIIKSEVLIACSAANRIALFDISKVVDGGVSEEVNLTLTFRNRFILGAGPDLRGICWALKSEFSMTVLAASSTSLCMFEIDKFLDIEIAPIPLQPTSTIARYHSSTVNALSFSGKAGLFASSSLDDESVSIWDMGSEKPVDLFREKYPEGAGMPLSLGFHPFGRRIVFGCENNYRELAVTYHDLETMQEFPSKAVFNGPKGEAFVNNGAVSLVKYSNTGMYLAVITGNIT
jgi:WD40 repeat protein